MKTHDDEMMEQGHASNNHSCRWNSSADIMNSSAGKLNGSRFGCMAGRYNSSTYRFNSRACSFFIKLVLLLTVQVILATMCEFIASADTVSAKATRRTYMDNMSTSTRRLWQCSCRATPLCVAECSKDVRCASVFYNKVTKKCQGHSVTFGYNDDAETIETESRYYVQTFGEAYIGDVCLSDAGCQATNSECRDGVCACTPGYSFSPQTHQCVDDCAEFGDDFMAIHDHYISKTNMETFQPVSIADCYILCRNRTEYTCRSLEYGWSSEKCFLQNVTVLDKPARWYVDTIGEFNISYFQRDCL